MIKKSQIINEAKRFFSNAFPKAIVLLRKSLPQIIAVLLALLVGALVLAATGHSPIEAYAAILTGAFGGIHGIGQTLTQATPIIFTALAFLFAFKCGLFNIGAEGQLLMGGLTAALVGISTTGLPAFVHLPLALIAGAAGGALWGLFPAVLKAKLGANEVITTLMLSYVAVGITSYMVAYPIKAPGMVPQTVLISASAELPGILPPTQLSASFIIALISAGMVAYLLQRTTIGYEIRAIGLNAKAAESGGISIKKGIILALVASGALAGLGGAGEILGVHHRFIDGFSPGYGWDGLAVALIGGLNPYGAIFAAVFIGALRSGGQSMSRSTGVPLDIVFILQALVILFVAAPRLIKYLLKRSGYKW
ncbi:ABC transporter permease [Candidatus Bathyarchaeota archaeon]|nr:ABC transporter permease [Candidatus Bathyarchaeota archaeon]